MEGLSPRFSDKPGKTLSGMYSAFSTFRYEDGYIFTAVDLGSRGVKIELNQEYNVGAAIILPAQKVQECGKWLLQSLGQNSFGLPEGLSEILDRIVKHKKSGRILERGDKTIIRDALKVLRSDQRKVKTEAKVLRLISANAI